MPRPVDCTKFLSDHRFIKFSTSSLEIFHSFGLEGATQAEKFSRFVRQHFLLLMTTSVLCLVRDSAHWLETILVCLRHAQFIAVRWKIFVFFCSLVHSWAEMFALLSITSQDQNSQQNEAIKFHAAWNDKCIHCMPHSSAIKCDIHSSKHTRINKTLRLICLWANYNVALRHVNDSWSNKMQQWNVTRYTVLNWTVAIKQVHIHLNGHSGAWSESSKF